MSTTAPVTELSREELEHRVRSLEGQLAAASGPHPVDANEQNRPWQVAKENAGEEHLRDVAPLPYRGPGAVIHHFPHITGGSGGPQTGPYVRALAEMLAELGYHDNEVIAGRVGHYENTLAGDVARFRRDNDVRENVDAYNGHAHPAHDVARNLVGPYTIQAIFDKVAEHRDQPVSSVVGQVEYDIHRQQR